MLDDYLAKYFQDEGDSAVKGVCNALLPLLKTYPTKDIKDTGEFTQLLEAVKNYAKFGYDPSENDEEE